MKYAYRNGFVLDGSENMKPVPGKVILTDGDKIEKIISNEELIGLTGYEKIDLNKEETIYIKSNTEYEIFGNIELIKSYV